MKSIVLSSNTSWYLWNFRKNTIIKLLSSGCSVYCIAPLDEFSAKLEGIGATFVPIKLDGKSTGLLRELKAISSIYKTLKIIKPDFVFNFTIKINLYSGLVCRLLSVPYANNVSGLGTVFLHKGLIYSLAQKLYGVTNHRASRVFFQNSEDMDSFIKLNLVKADRTRLLPGSGIDIEHFSYTQMPDRVDAVVFIMIARLIADKGVREYVDASRKLIGRGVNVKCILVGPGGVSNKTAITDDEIARWEADGVVNCVGEQKDVIPWIQKAHVLVLPSYREGMPRTVLEAASIGRPAIVTDVPGCRQSIVDNETGWLCKVRDAEDLARVMAMVAAKPLSELEQAGCKARERIEKEFAESIVIEHYLDCLKIE
ncbi:N,N'-diacetylbacillosaminyl-diphospho-undecaprenol alpha-1,3-N-acetylgalactosaminyltransferase [BD1-7 clade bacterium]|uniref:N,N'-diacetylbacillosaminyl-diphospho-undecaprenol alpha-1,3-N-acetylgalactosaminyltransferase n=1 Tax=BD1-7 clade bacterium TaxID=2029982 RepID=A0A5S9MVD8_9GAMM|nr:N,N'-diacetylbacillosaminyl-diphospho-undecaprenol alpha-1,3-N-acetylgalactosaminyltransferase [BD1-7 clade bacterium]CAA0083843.1 N,N'-diacetylbacillosaminyl-diphospho-undecaprenol alpha-1,3-N-acetylgalactosaminyltransferase [BD1-7 clade bacterium]